MSIENKKYSFEIKNHKSKVKAFVPHKLGISTSLIGVRCNIALCFLLCIYLPGFVVSAEVSPEQFDPVIFLPNVYAESLQEANEPKILRFIDELYKLPGLPVPLAVSQNGKFQQQPQTAFSSAESTAVNSNIEVDKELQQNGFNNAKKPDTHFALQLWRAEIAVPDSEDNKSEKELQQLIEQIRSIEFETENKTPQPVIVVEPTPKTEPDEALSSTKTPVEPVVEESQESGVKSEQGTQKIESSDKKQDVQSEDDQPYSEPSAPNVLPYEPVTAETLQMLENLSQQLDQMDNPLVLGDVLFLSGDLKQAAEVYQQALGRESAEDADSARDKAWILFQMANSLRNDDLEMAAKNYRQLITQYPDSPWTELARAQDELIDWYRKENPQQLIKENP